MSGAPRILGDWLKRIGEVLAWVAAIGSAIATIAVLMAPSFKWAGMWFVPFVRERIVWFWLTALTAVGLIMWMRVRQIRQRLTIGFTDDFKGEASRNNWDYTGNWGFDERTLIITASDPGGLTKVGALWDNYTFECEARIVKKCIGLIVRAVDLDNYYMFQITEQEIVPHRRVAVYGSVSEGENTIAGMRILQEPTVGWVIYPDLTAPFGEALAGWFTVRIVVRGESVSIYVNRQLALQLSAFLKIPAGKVGFRNWENERAFVRKVRVYLH